MSRKRSKPRLTPVWLPWIRAHLAQYQQDRLVQQSQVLQSVSYEGILAQAWSEADALRVAPLWWVSRDMTTLSVDTAQAGGLPDVEPPSLTGFMVFDGGLPLDFSDMPIAVPSINAIYWIIDGSEPSNHGRVWIIRPHLYTTDPDIRTAHGGLPLAEIPQALHPAVTQVLGDILIAVWALSQEPRVCQTRQAQSSPLDRVPVAHDPQQHHVKMLVLRENLRNPLSHSDTNEPRVWTHRWIVRGFWRNQAFGPDHSLRRKQWIPPFVKGPANLPLIHKETVRIWRR
ncbi:hypothetical protein [Bombiscardovia coagulans]|uniref:Uncharacterized protein n=1 Tax=Bombiscardovia coagulans TaxID=686666 RepID=A0A261ESG6_9BIFI|nr:hypothetical protein [Bombiscardovia coagulans]OZG49810.1 hypothetical protein BOCO_0327 [Bombiscardovia coagulans]